MDAQLNLYDTKTRQKRVFIPLDVGNVRVYVCGPTVYDRAHIGNARPFIVFDVLIRLLRHVYGAGHVTYVRNITDIDDKINTRAKDRGIAIGELTRDTIADFHDDIDALHCLRPTQEPRATDYVAQMRRLIDRLVERGHAYVADDHVLFAVNSLPAYGELSRRSLDEMLAGARIDVAPYKRDGLDFVLWKPSRDGEPAWPSPAGIEAEGRPGWHIECSAMAAAHLGERFDIHGGGIDLAFPHHENERAQTLAATGADEMASFWMHNGFLQVEGRKMSKSEGNFITIRDALDVAPGDTLRLAMLMTHYRQPIDWTAKRVADATVLLRGWAASIGDLPDAPDPPNAAEADRNVLAALCDDLNTPLAIARLGELAKAGDRALYASAAVMGIDLMRVRAQEAERTAAGDPDAVATVDKLVAERLAAKAERRFADADAIRDQLAKMGVAVKDGKGSDGAPTSTWEFT
ncbi:MAG: cysteine--tRNA ligase [Pseudomonadota bacterium]